MPSHNSFPRSIRVGSLRLELDPNGTFARAIGMDDEEIFRGIGFVVRDADWGTPALPAEVAIERQGERVIARSSGRLDHATGDLDWSVEWAIGPVFIEAVAKFSSSRGFDTNRTGFVVLHSLPASRGRPVSVTHPGGARQETVFPDLISGHQPFFDIAGLDYETVAANRVSLAFEGEVFEIEDQRNWTDASYKTYCRPLRLPFPYRLAPGAEGVQRLRLAIQPAARRPPAPSDSPVVLAKVTLPRFGTHLPPGPMKSGQAEAVADLDLGFCAIEVDLDSGDWLGETRMKLAEVSGPVRIDIRNAAPVAILDAIRALAPLLAGRTLIGLSLFDADPSTVAAARALVPDGPIGGGTGSFFTELNRMAQVPDAGYLAWTSNPTVHGSDDDTIGETTEVMTDILRTAKAKFPGRRFQIGPMTLGMRFNPNASTPEGRRRSAGPDPRQGGLIAAAWLGATAAGFLDDAVDSLCFFEAVGQKGLVTAEDRVTPAGHLLSRLAALAGHDARVVRWPDAPRASGILVETSHGQALCLAHARHGSASLALPKGRWSRLEVLTDGGFALRDRPPGRAVEMEGFSVAWLSEG